MAHRNPNLVPKTVVNRNGHTTTVYTRPTGTPPSPTLTVPTRPVAEPTAGRSAEQGLLAAVLAGPTDRGPAALRSFIDQRRGLTTSLLETMEGRHAVALAMDFIDAGLLLAGDTDVVLTGVQHETEGCLGSDALRVAAHLFNADPGCRRLLSLHRLIGALRGTHQPEQGWTGEPITTVEQLHSTAAVVDFIARILQYDSNSNTRLIETTYHSGGLTITPDPGLTLILREYPHDRERIAELMTERGIHDHPAEGLTLLREMLEAEGAAPALGNGWL